MPMIIPSRAYEFYYGQRGVVRRRYQVCRRSLFRGSAAFSCQSILFLGQKLFQHRPLDRISLYSELI
jgi:hypothetical protein